MMAVARTVQLGDKKHGGEEHDNEPGAEARRNASNMQSEFIGGDNDVDDESDLTAEELMRKPSPLAYMTLQTIKSILQRDDEIEAAKKPGRHRDSDMQMKAFADHFGEELGWPKQVFWSFELSWAGQNNVINQHGCLNGCLIKRVL
jgi:hypothetical protein